MDEPTIRTIAAEFYVPVDGVALGAYLAAYQGRADVLQVAVEIDAQAGMRSVLRVYVERHARPEELPPIVAAGGSNGHG